MGVLVPVAIVVGSIVLGALAVTGQAVWRRVRDRRRARARGLRFAGLAEVTVAMPSLVAPQVGKATRDFRDPPLLKALRRLPVHPRGILTLPSGGGRIRLGWEPDDRSRRRGARPWQLDAADIEYVEERGTIWDVSGQVRVGLVDGSMIQLGTASATDLRAALAGAGVRIGEAAPKKVDGAPSPPLPAPVTPRLPGEDRVAYALRRRGEVEERRRALQRYWDDWARWRLAAVPSLRGRTRTWDDVADFVGMPPAEVRRLLKDASREDLARLGLRDEALRSRGRRVV